MNGDLGNHSSTCFFRGRIWEADVLTDEIEELKKVGCIRNLSQKTECERSPDNTKR